MNNLPTDVMRAMGARVVIGVDVSGHGLPEARMKPWPDALSGVGILLRQWLPGWLGGGPTCPTMAAMQSHLPYVTDYANAARRFGTVDIMVRPVVADIPILAFGRYAEIVRAGHEAGLRAVRAWKLANPDVLPALDDGARAWRPAAGGGGGRRTRRGAALPSAETLTHTRAAPTLGPTATSPNANARTRREPRVDFFSAGGDSTAVAAKTKTRGKGRTIVPARAGVGTIGTRIPTTAAAAAGAERRSRGSVARRRGCAEAGGTIEGSPARISPRRP